MDVSVIIPYYNRKELFSNSLSSLDKCIYSEGDVEIIVIEDGSNDFTEESFRNYQKRIRYFRNEKKINNRYHCPPRNIGISKAVGEVVIFLDCDQIVKKDFIEKHVRFFKKNGDAILQFGCRKNLKKNQSVNNLDTAEYDDDARKELFKIYQSCGENMLGNWANVWSHNISILKKNVDSFGGFDENFTGWGLEDQEFGYRMKRAGLKILYNSEIEVYHQYHKPAMGQSIYLGWMKNYEYFVKKYNQDLEVKVVNILGEILNTAVDRRIRRDKITTLSNLNYKRFEMILRCLKKDTLSDEDTAMFNDKDDFFNKNYIASIKY